MIKATLESTKINILIFFTPKIIQTIMITNFNKLQFWFYSSSFIMEPEPKLHNFFGSGSGSIQKGQLRLRNSGWKYFDYVYIS